MTDLITIIILTLASGSCIPVGGFIASIEHISPNWLEEEFRHFTIAFGGGILLGAVALVLVPEGTVAMKGSVYAIPCFILGGIVFFIIERYLGLHRREAPQFLGMLLDYIPEAIALGGLLAIGSSSAILLAILIGLQNLPEGFNSFRELVYINHSSAKKTLILMCSVVMIGPIVGVLSYFYLSQLPVILGAIMLFASGGILYLIFQDIAPQSRLDKHWAPPLGAVLGFSLALIGQIIV